MDKHYYCIIMAGGTGSRLWPLSRVSFPKQFTRWEDGEKSFLRLTWERFSKVVPQSNILVVTQSRYEPLLRQDIPELQENNLLLEPYSRSTAPCIAYSIYYILKRDPDAVVVVSPSDHIIHKEDCFRADILSSLDYAGANDVLVTLGIAPTRADTNFGYIQVTGGKTAVKSSEPVKVKAFTEKPDKQMASVFYNSGEFLWNSGIIVSRATVLKDEMSKYMSEMTGQFTGWETALGTDEESTFILKAYGGCERISIDFGVMEKTDRCCTLPASFDWADIGAWDSLYNWLPDKDEDGNATDSKHFLSEDNSRTLVLSTNKDKLLAIKGLSDYLVIDTQDVLLICPRNPRQIKNFTAALALPEYGKFK